MNTAIQNTSMMENKKGLLIPAFLFTITTLACSVYACAQANVQKVRLAKLIIDSSQLEQYKAALKVEIETSLLVEPGVLTLYAVAEKNNPTHITILEIYANDDAYNAHIKTPHFLKYKTGTKDMVKALELVDTTPLLPGLKF